MRDIVKESLGAFDAVLGPVTIDSKLRELEVSVREHGASLPGATESRLLDGIEATRAAVDAAVALAQRLAGAEGYVEALITHWLAAAAVLSDGQRVLSIQRRTAELKAVSSQLRRLDGLRPARFPWWTAEQRAELERRLDAGLALRPAPGPGRAMPSAFVTSVLDRLGLPRPS